MYILLCCRFIFNHTWLISVCWGPFYLQCPHYAEENLKMQLRPTVYTNPSQKGVFENTAWKCRLLISMWTENENWAFQKCWLTHDNHVIFLTAISSNTDSKWPLIFAFSNSTLYCGQKTFDVFWEFMKPPFSNSPARHERDLIFWFLINC